MNKVVVAIVIAFFVAAGLGLADEPGPGEPKKLLYFDGGPSYISTLNNGIKVGDKIVDILKEKSIWQDSRGKAINLAAPKRKTLVISNFSIGFQDECFVSDLARIYGTSLDIVVVDYREEIIRISEGKSCKRDFTQDGISVVEWKQFRWPSNTWTLIDKQGVVADIFEYTLTNRKRTLQTIDNFVNLPDYRGSFSPIFSPGKATAIPTMVDVNGEKFDLEKYRGKPVILMCIDPLRLIERNIALELAAKWHTQYAGQAQVVLIFDYRNNPELPELEKEFFERNNWNMQYRKADSISTILAGLNRDIPAFFDTTGSLTRCFYPKGSIGISTALFIFDKDLMLYNGYALYRDDVTSSCQPIEADSLVNQEMMKLLGKM